MFYLLFLQFCILDHSHQQQHELFHCRWQPCRCHQKHLHKFLPKIFKSLPLATRQLPESGSLIRLLFSALGSSGSPVRFPNPLASGHSWQLGNLTTGSPASSSVSCLAGFCVFLPNPFFGPFSLWFTALPSSYVRIIHKFFYSYQCLTSSFQSVYSVLQLVWTGMGVGREIMITILASFAQSYSQVQIICI